MYFQASDYKGKQFLDLDNDDETIAPTYIKGGAWLKHVGHSNTLTVRITCLITNHAPTGEYRKRFFLNKLRACPCQKALVETRHHILYKCERHKQSWNPLRRSINDIITFLKFNPRAFSFQDNILQKPQCQSEVSTNMQYTISNVPSSCYLTKGPSYFPPI